MNSEAFQLSLVVMRKQLNEEAMQYFYEHCLDISARIGFFTLLLMLGAAVSWEVTGYVDEKMVLNMIVGASIVSILLFGGIAYVAKSFLK